jgi:drug/metabolite transporter (DMT)-like permease
LTPEDSVPHPADNARGIAAMSAAVVLFFVNDTLMKLVAVRLPIGEIFFFRGLFATVLVAAAVWATGAWRALPLVAHPMVAVRLFGEVVSGILYMAGFIVLSVADATALFQVTPLAATAAAAVFLKETVGWRRWLAVLVGFAGVLVILRPGTAGFSPAALFIVASVGFVIVRDFATVGIPRAVPTLIITGTSSVTLGLVGPLMIPIEPYLSSQPSWVMPIGTDLVVLAAAALCMLLGYVFMTRAFRTAEMSVVAPLRYTVLVWSFLAAIFLFGQTPDLPTWIGAAIIVASGFYTFRRERLRRQQTAAGSSAASPAE